MVLGLVVGRTRRHGRCAIALDGLGVGLQAVAALHEQPAGHRSLTRWPFSRNAPVSEWIDFDVHRNGDIGSPLVTGSINDSNVATKSSSWPGPLTAAPARRHARAGSRPVLASLRPRRTVSTGTPVASATWRPRRPNSAAPRPTPAAAELRMGPQTAYRRATESARSAIAQP